MVEAYYDVHKETYLRTGVQPHPKAYFEGIARQSTQHHLLWVGFDPLGKPVSFHNDARFQHSSLYHTGCSETAHMNSGINYLLFWEAIVGAKADSCRWYEIGEAFLSAAEGKDKGLNGFKSKFGGELHRFFRGELFIEPAQKEPQDILTIPLSLEQPLNSYRVVFRNWVYASRDLLAAVIGRQAVRMLGKSLRALWGFIKGMSKLKPSRVFSDIQTAFSKRENMPEKIAARTRDIYSQDGVYKVDTVDHLPSETGELSYSETLLKIRLDLVRQYSPADATVLDVCCATGKHLQGFLGTMHSGVGVDFSFHYLQRAVSDLRQDPSSANVKFLCCDATQIPLRSNSFDVAYSFSALYQIPQVESVIHEMARAVKTDGVCIFDLGNLYSLNTIVLEAYPDLPDHCHISLARMKKNIRDSGLYIVEHRAFQILPMWSDRPKWLGLFLLPVWTRLLSKKIAGRMLDEWISSLPVLKFFAFRHVFVCKKG